MSCSECRGYHVSYCPCCDDSEYFLQKCEDDLEPVIAEITEKINSGEIDHSDLLADFAITEVKKVANDQNEEYYLEFVLSKFKNANLREN